MIRDSAGILQRGAVEDWTSNIGNLALAGGDTISVNLLAVAVELFSLLVYDRVIPHQSTATLRLLAS